ncbi:RNA methyltransferase [Pusillimonas sp. MFBS29]|uniref:TrmH family RNA methyltransferase n=1 Tax=Pusillimonas sp. MFBS29 TaxID=2886690 RepID=UPI001D115E6A|nr:RNA methyltransferase [Pusillimonas sp. MFBS29]MCC2595534.1 RNA methyltransferase [Pusillimonas sp. MFBS29]
MKHISSRDNAVYKQLSRLAAGKREKGADGHVVQRVVLEGVHLCQAWLQHVGVPELALFDLQKLETQSELQALANVLPAGACLSCEPRLAAGLSQVGHGQGVYFLATTPTPTLPDHIDHNCLWLDHLQDPGNVGTLLRTAAAAGIQHAYLSAGCASAWSPKVLRSAQGAHFVMTIHEHMDLAALRKRLDVPLVATALHDAQSLYDVALPAECAWVFGNEGQGVDPALLAQADIRVFIPQAADVESLNVAVAAGVCLFEQRRVILHA